MERPSLEAHLGATKEFHVIAGAWSRQNRVRKCASEPRPISRSSFILPTLIYCGDKDPGHDSAREAADAMPNATFVSLAGLNHTGALLENELMLPHARALMAGVVKSAVGQHTQRIKSTL